MVVIFGRVRLNGFSVLFFKFQSEMVGEFAFGTMAGVDMLH
jgi:hypothetical protein